MDVHGPDNAIEARSEPCFQEYPQDSSVLHAETRGATLVVDDANAPKKKQEIVMEDTICFLHQLAMLDLAQALQSLEHPDRNVAIHQCRKSIKHLRALLKLTCAADQERSRKIDRLLGKASRLLSPARDSVVVVDTARSLDPSRFTPAVQAALQWTIAGDRPDQKSGAARILTQATTQIDRFLDRNISEPDAVIAQALQLSHDQIRQQAYRYRTQRTESSAHQLRKVVQARLTQISTFGSAMGMDKQTEADYLARIARHLGDHHDLAVLRLTLKKVPTASLARDDRKRIRRQARARQRVIDSTVTELLVACPAFHIGD